MPTPAQTKCQLWSLLLQYVPVALVISAHSDLPESYADAHTKYSRKVKRLLDRDPMLRAVCTLIGMKANSGMQLSSHPQVNPEEIMEEAKIHSQVYLCQPKVEKDENALQQH